MPDTYEAIDQVKISDLDLACTMLCEGIQLIGVVDGDVPGRMEFVLGGQRPVLATIIADYSLGSARVEPKRFGQARRVLQAALRDHQNGRTRVTNDRQYRGQGRRG